MTTSTVTGTPAPGVGVPTGADPVEPFTVLSVLPVEVREHLAFVAFVQVVEDVIAPAAVEVDRTEVPRSHLDALATTGFFGWTVPVEHGGSPVPPAVHAAALELLFGACPSTGLVAAQHFGPVQHALRLATPELLALLPELAAGRRIGAGAFGHVRSWPARRTVSAQRVDGGYRFDGDITWLSGWGVVDLPWVGAIDEQHDEVVYALVDLPDDAAVASEIPLAAIQGSRTVCVHLDGLFVPAERVIMVQDVTEWKAQDEGTSPVPGHPGGPVLPGPLGLATVAVADALAKYPGEPSLLALADEVRELRAAPPTGAAGRARANDLAARATAAGVLARGGAGLLTSDVAQVRSRAAAFLQVRALSSAVRTAGFATLVRSA